MTEPIKTTVFAVMKLIENVEAMVQGEPRLIKVEGLRGYIPVFKTIEEAQENSSDNKFQILPMTI